MRTHLPAPVLPEGARMLPPLTEANRAFWTSGASGTWHLPRCRECRRFVHPGQFRCPWCLTDSLEPEAVSGRGTVFTFTVNRYSWLENWEVPYVAAIVELPEQAGLRVTTNVIGEDPASVHIGMALEVAFSHEGDYWVPVFRRRNS